MAVDERSRHELYERLAQALGTEAAVTMMEHLPPVGWADVATKHDLDQLEQRLEQRFEHGMDMRFAAVDARFERLEQRFEARFELVDERFETMGQRLEALENRLLAAFRGEIAAALTSQTRVIIFTMAGSVVTIGGFAVAIAPGLSGTRPLHASPSCQRCATASRSWPGTAAGAAAAHAQRGDR